MNRKFNLENIKKYIEKIKNQIKKENKTKLLIIGCILAVVVFLGALFITNNAKYNFSISEYNSYVENFVTNGGVVIKPLTTKDKSVKNIYNKFQSRDYNNFLYIFNLEKLVNTKPLNENINIILKIYPQANLNGKILNIYKYDENSNTFNCLGETRIIDNNISITVKSEGKHFLTLVEAPTYDIDNEKLIYNSDFNNEYSINNNWNYDIGNNDGWGNNEEEYYTQNNSNSYIKDNNLNITAIKESYEGKNYTSARLVSKQNFLYGKFEISAKLPQGNGMWPAIWMLPSTNTYGSWPNSGEIDIMESIGRQPNHIRGSLQMNAYNFKKGNQITNDIIVNNIYSDYHNYDVLWTPNIIQISVDNNIYLTYNRNLYDIQGTSWEAWPFDEPFNIILNIAVGGSYGGEVDNSIFPQTMSINSIKVYDLGLNDYKLNTIR